MFRIGIVGFGFVGQAVYGSITPHRSEVCVYDKYKEMGSIESINKSQIVFVCVPTPTINGVQSTEELDEVMSWLTGPLIVIKSTVLPTWFEKHPTVVYNPEFLNQNNAISDFRNQESMVIGARADLALVLENVYNNYFTIDSDRIFCSLKEAAEFKYTHNLYHAYKALFWHYVQELTGNQRKMFSMYSKLYGTNESREMARICADGEPGVGGACFPKDMVAINSMFNHELTKMMIGYNSALRTDTMEAVL
jgi:UDPglucose 6-dehydrogenase